jgi:serine/threonine protein kinase
VHRDLKPENIMLQSKENDSDVKVIDWGTSRVFDPKKRMKRLVGTVRIFLSCLNLLSPIILLQKFWTLNMMKNVTFGP